VGHSRPRGFSIHAYERGPNEFSKEGKLKCFQPSSSYIDEAECAGKSAKKVATDRVGRDEWCSPNGDARASFKLGGSRP